MHVFIPVIILGCLITFLLFLNLYKTTKMKELIQQLTDKVTEETNVEKSAVALMQNLATKLSDAISKLPTDTDTAALQSIVDTLTANNAELAGAVTANTPAA